MLFPAFRAVEIRQRRMKDRTGNTLKPQERFLAFVSAPQPRHAPRASGGRSRPTPTALGSRPGELTALSGLAGLHSLPFPPPICPS